jgi:acyl-coenzyme A synthetase/AMP-(fatty) acid ligase
LGFLFKQSGLRGFEVDDEQPDPQRTEIVKAVIVLKSGVGTDGSHSSGTPAFCMPSREIELTIALAKTPGGKIQRSILCDGA